MKEAQIARFYGLKWYEMEVMPVKLYLEYFNAIERIRADETLRALEVSTFPTLKKKARQDIFKKYRDISEPTKEVQRFEDAFKEISKWQTKK